MPSNSGHALFRARGGKGGDNVYRLTKDPEMRERKDAPGHVVYLYAGNDRFVIYGNESGNDLAGRVATYANKGEQWRIESTPDPNHPGWHRVSSATKA